MAALLIDVGNTNFKWRWQTSDATLEGAGSSREPCTDAIARLAADIGAPERVGLACVKSQQYQEAMLDALRQHFAVEPFVARVSGAACGLVNSYQDPARMGIDRWLAMIGVRHGFEGAFCVMDCGSAVTADWVSETGQHLGGFILAGLRLSVGALLAGTDQVIVDYDKLEHADILPGASTTDAVYNGALFSLVAQVRSAYQHLQRIAGDGASQLVLTGGDAHLLARHLDCPCRIVGGLVFEGLEVMMNAAGDA
ncbi:MAG: type III pantothenate kinase [Ketobacteraceae bacterium]|nr:type III pantothenate kinase [Ketobacteraceae bacterium]